MKSASEVLPMPGRDPLKRLSENPISVMAAKFASIGGSVPEMKLWLRIKNES